MQKRKNFKTHLKIIFTIFFVTLIANLCFLFFNYNYHPIKTNVTFKKASVTNPNLSIKRIDLAAQLKCKWWEKTENESSIDAIRRASFSQVDCSNYFPDYYAKKIFVSFTNLSTITSFGLAIKTQNSDTFIFPNVIEASNLTIFNKLDEIQTSLQSNVTDTPRSIFERLNVVNNALTVIYELPEHTKIQSFHFGITKVGGAIQKNQLSISGTVNQNYQLYGGYISPDDNIRLINNRISSNSSSKKRYVKFLDRPFQNTGSNSKISSDQLFINGNRSRNQWNRIAFPNNLVTRTRCKDHVEKDLKITSFEKVGEFCDYLNKIYSQNQFYNSTTFTFSPLDFPSFLGDFINPNIDGEKSLSTLAWDLVFFPHTKATYKTFNLIAIGDLFLQKIFSKYVNASAPFLLKDLTISNVNITNSIMTTYLLPLFELGNFTALDFSNNNVTVEQLSVILNQPNLTKLTLIENFIDMEQLDLSSLTKLENLWIETNAFKFVTFNSSNLRNVTIKNVGASLITGLDASTNYELINVDNNNLTSLNFSNNVVVKKLSVKNNNFLNFTIFGQQQFETIDLSNNKLRTFTLRSDKRLKHLFLSHNQISTLSIDTPTIETLIADNNNISTMVLKTDNLKRVDFSENTNINEVLNNLSFSAPKLEYFKIADAKLSTFDNSWLSLTNKELELIITNENEDENDDNQLKEIILDNLVNLKVLNLSNIGLETLAITNISTIEKLDVSNNPIKTITYNEPSLKEINISSVSTNQSLFDLVTNNNRKIEKLNLANTNSNWNDVLGVLFFNRLTDLDISGNNLIEVPDYFLRFRSQLKRLNYSTNNLKNRFDAFGFLQLEYLNLSNNQNVLSIINLDSPSSLTELILKNIPRAIDKITLGNNNLTILDLSNTETRIVKEVKTLFPNVINLNVSGNHIVDLFELVGSSTTTLTTSNPTNEIINDLPTVEDIIYLNSDFNLIDFVKNLAISNKAYRIHLTPERISLDGDLSVLDIWYESLLGKKIFLVDENEDIIFIDEQIVDQFFKNFAKTYKIKEKEVYQYRDVFERTNRILNVDGLRESKNKINLFLKTKFTSEVAKVISKIDEYNKNIVLQSQKINENIDTFRVTLYLLLTSVIVLALLIVTLIGWLLYRKANIKDE